MKGALFRLSREGHPNPSLASQKDEAWWEFTEETLSEVSWAKLSATGRKNPLEKCLKFCPVICRVDGPMQSRNLYDIK